MWAISSRRALLELVRQRLDEVGASERIGRVGGAALVREHLLRAEGDPGRMLRRERERLVEAVRVQALGAAAGRRERLDRDPDDVVLRLLRGQRRAAGLGVEAERERLRVRRAEAVAHQRRPEPPGGAELRHLLEEVVVGVEEEGEARAELVRREARLDRCGAVGDPVRERERELLDGRRAGLSDVVAGDRDRVPARDPLRAVGEEIRGQSHRRPRREDVVPARDVLLEDVVLHGAAERRPRHALLLRDELVEQEEERRGRVDRHRGRDLAERDRVEEDAHVLERVDRDARAADLAERVRIVRVVAELGRQVEGDREPRLAPLEQVAEAPVRLLGGREAGVLADRPGPAPVHVRIRPARVGELAGLLAVAVDGPDLDPGIGLALVRRRHGTDARRCR